MNYAQHFNPNKTPQSEPIHGKSMVPNSAGGHVFAVDKWVRLRRFLVLGSEGGSYYATERKLTRENAEAVLACLDENPGATIETVVEISQCGRAPKNDPALFVLALAASSEHAPARRSAMAALPEVARIGTHLFTFASYANAFRGWGRGLRRAVASWYNEMEPSRLSYQVSKYQQRGGWSHRDLLRLCHAKGDEGHNAIYRYVVSGNPEGCNEFIEAVEAAKAAKTKTEVTRLIREHNLPRECVPTEWLRDRDIWRALLDQMPMTAMIRNLGKMSATGLLVPLGEDAKIVCSRLRDTERLRSSRVHPVTILGAMLTYSSGHGVRGKLTWEPIPQITEALDDAFHASFEHIEPTGKRIVLALDVSGSMTMGEISGVAGLTPRLGAAAMAMATARTEENYHVMAFSQGFISLPVSAGQRLDRVVRMTSGLPFEGTDCAVPMLWASQKGVKADAFVIYTDSETWFGQVHPCQALQAYRDKFGIPAKLIVVGMVSNGFTIADPEDAGMMDVVGFDSAAPSVISNFIRQ